MAVISTPSFIQANSHSAQTDRRHTRTFWGGRGGVVPTTATFTDLKVTQRGAGANMSVDVAEGTVLVTGTEATYQGLYHGDAQGVTNVPITTAHATNPRRDMIVARVKDAEYSGATNTFSIESIDGTPAASPVDPTVPANCVVLARVAVAAAVSSITNAVITDLRAGYAAVTGSAVIGNQVKAAALGGVVPCTSAFRPTKGLYEGLAIWETDTKLLYVYNGSSFELTTAVVPAAWTGPSYINSWTNFGAPYLVGGYRKVGDRVELRGLIAAGTVSLAAFVLPVGFRPTAQLPFAAISGGNIIGRTDIQSDGQVVITAGNNGFHSLNGIMFSTS